MLRIPRQIWFLPVADSAYNAENAQFGLVMTDLLFIGHAFSHKNTFNNNVIKKFERWEESGNKSKEGAFPITVPQPRN